MSVPTGLSISTQSSYELARISRVERSDESMHGERMDIGGYTTVG